MVDYSNLIAEVSPVITESHHEAINDIGYPVDKMNNKLLPEPVVSLRLAVQIKYCKSCGRYTG